MPDDVFQNKANRMCLAVFCNIGEEAAMAATAMGRAAMVFREHGGTLRTSQAETLGINRTTIYRMLKAGQVDRLARGLYRLADMPLLGDPDLVVVTQRVADCVVCLVSALVYHDLTTQIPHEIQIAIGRAAGYPRVSQPPVRVFRYQETVLNSGVETHEMEGHPIRVFSAEKTIADCFKYRNKVGLDIALEALRLYWQRRRPDVPTLMKYAHICWVDRVIRPHLEILLVE